MAVSRCGCQYSVVSTGLSAEGDGEAGWPAQSADWLPRRRPSPVGARYPAGDGLQRLGDLQPGQVGSEAVVHARTEVQDRRQSLAGDVEAVGIVVDRGIAVGRSGIREDYRAGREPDPCEFDVLGDDAQD